MRRTMLFLPGNNPNMIANGGILGSDSIILDLEDAVAPDQKDAARELVKNALVAVDFGKCEIIIRINGLDTPYWEEDLEELIPLKPDAIMPPKVSSGDYIRQLDEKITQVEQKNGMKPGTTKLIALLETAQGIENAYEIACASERMTAMFLGAEDLTADLRCARTKEGGEIAYARGRIVCAARAAGIEVYDTPFTDVEDLQGLEKDARLAKGLGFTGKASISPRHVDCINRVFSPTQKEIQYALDVFAAIEQAKAMGKGAISLRGKMIDAPIVQRAKIVLDAAREIGGLLDE